MLSCKTIYTRIEINRICRKYLIQTVLLILVVTVLVKGCELAFHCQSLWSPIAVSVVFSLLVELADVLVWKKAARHSSESLTTFYSAVSGFRMLLALAALFVCFLVVGRDAMSSYVLVFLVYYVTLLTHHAIFFSRLSNRHNQLGNNNNCAK